MVNEPMKKKIWQRFVSEGVLETARLQKRIEESWYLCKQSGVDPFDGKGRTILTPKELQSKLNQNKQLTAIAGPIMEKVLSSIHQANTMILLVDREGFILTTRGSDSTVKRASEINFVAGSKWTEETVGTNAVGTALRTGEAITVIGTDHYSVASQSFSCSAAPIYTPDGTLLGVLDMTSSLADSRHEHMLAAVCAAAYAIEQQWAAADKLGEQSLIVAASRYRLHPAPIAAALKNGKVIWINEAMKQHCRLHTPFFLHEMPEQEWKQESEKLLLTDVHVQGGRIIQFSFLPKTKGVAGWSKTFKYSGVAGASPAFQKALWQAERVAKTEAAVHIFGETGTGKEILAKAIHDNSSRASGPFVAVNCGAIPPSLMESELFGYESGSFTGANRSGYTGKIRAANGGTLFLDEIGDIPEQMQVSLLRVLQEQEVIPVGSSKPVPVQVRIITATHRNLLEMVENGLLREDLFYRIYVFPIQLPPLRDRLDDLELFIADYQKRHNWPVAIPRPLLRAFRRHAFPGNFRELFNTLDRLRILYGDFIPPDLPASECLITPVNKKSKKWSLREKREREKISEALERASGHVPTAADQMGVPRSTFYRKLKKYEMI